MLPNDSRFGNDFLQQSESLSRVRDTVRIPVVLHGPLRRRLRVLALPPVNGSASLMLLFNLILSSRRERRSGFEAVS